MRIRLSRSPRLLPSAPLIDNLYVMGRNGMHRYNDMDHSMLSARAAVRAMGGEGTREQIWDVNAEGEPHEASPREGGAQ